MVNDLAPVSSTRRRCWTVALFCWACLAGLFSLNASAAPEPPPGFIDQEWRDRVVMGYYADSMRDAAQSQKRAAQAVQEAKLNGALRGKLRATSYSFFAASAKPDDCKVIDEQLRLAKSGGEQTLRELFDLSISARNSQRPLCATELPIEEITALARRLGDPARMYFVLEAKAADLERENRDNEALSLRTAQMDYAIADFQAVVSLIYVINDQIVTNPKNNKAKEFIDVAFRRLGNANFPLLRRYLNEFAFEAELAAGNLPAALVKAKAVEASLSEIKTITPTIAITYSTLAEALTQGGRPKEALALLKKIPDSIDGASNFELRYAMAKTLLYVYTAIGTEETRQKGLLEVQKLTKLLADPDIGIPRRALASYEMIAAFHEKFGDTKAALIALKQANGAREEKERLVNEKARIELQEKLNLAAKEQENTRLKAEAEVQAATQRGWISAFVAAALGVVGAGSALAVAVRRGRKLAKVSNELAQRNSELEERSATRIRLLAAACHDLRQPAHALGMLAELGSDAQREPSRFKAWLQSVKRSAASLGEMLDELMDLGRLDGGHYTPQLSEVSLAELMREVMLNFEGLAHRKGLALDVSSAESRVVSDRHLLRRIVFNLVSNAIKYTDTGFVRVRLSPQADGKNLLLTVQDSGPGIPQDKLSEVFRDYVRLNPSKAAEGLGIGLSIVRRAAGLLGHELHLESPPGAGTLVSLQLPLSSAPARASAEEVPREAEPTAAQGVLALMEDDADVREAMSALLMRWGYTVRAGLNAASVLALLQESQLQPDLIITDMHLGGHNGLDEVAQLRQALQAPALPALLVTGDVDAAIATQAAQAQVFVANKPLAPRRLSALVTQLLAAKPQAQRPVEALQCMT